MLVYQSPRPTHSRFAPQGVEPVAVVGGCNDIDFFALVISLVDVCAETYSSRVYIDRPSS